MLAPGDPLPWFVSRTRGNPEYNFQSVAGRYIVLCCFGSLSVPGARDVLSGFLASRSVFDDIKASFFAVSLDAPDQSSDLLADRIPGIRVLWDADQSVFNALDLLVKAGDAPSGQVAVRPTTLVLDRRLRVIGTFPIGADARHVPEVLECLRSAIANDAVVSGTGVAPVLLLPRIFEPDLCRALIRVYEDHGGEESGFMLERGGRTMRAEDYGHKRRRDCDIEDKALQKAIQVRIHRRLVPEVEKAFQFRATRMERYMVACYDAETGGHFKAHRDNTTKGTAHRKFAVTINLNAEAYEGGDLRFPEFGSQTYRAPTGGAVVFSCSLLHEATTVTRGRRYAFLPFLYDDAGAELRRRNNAYLAEGVTPYQGSAAEAQQASRPAGASADG